MKHTRYLPEGTKVHCFDGYRLKNGVVLGHNMRTKKYKIQSDEIFLARKDSVEPGWIDMEGKVWNEVELVPTVFHWSPKDKYVPVSSPDTPVMGAILKRRPAVNHLSTQVDPSHLVLSFP